MPISLNVLAQPTLNLSELVNWCVAAKPPYTLVMDGFDVAQRVQMASPGTRIIFRRHRADDNRLPEVMTPAQFLDSIADLPREWWAQAGNEPNGDQAQLIAWTVELMALATARGRRLAVGNWSVGNPDEQHIQEGHYDAILRALAGSAHVLGLHEYFHDQPAQEPYFVGRFRHWLKRADQLGIQRPVIVITEHGRDLGGGTNDGWRGQGWTEAQYAARLAQAQTVYNPYEVTACVFSYGPGYGWDSFNVAGAPELLAQMAQMNAEADMAPPGWKMATTKQEGANVRVRAAPGLSAQTLGTVKTGDWLVRLSDAVVLKDNYTWAAVAVQKDALTHWHGFIALEVIDL